MPRPATKSHFEKVRQFCWVRAHKSTSPKWRTFWFDHFEIADQFSHLVD